MTNTMNLEQMVMDMIERNNFSGEKVFGATQKQIDAINRIAAQKGVQVDESRLQTVQSASAYMQELYDMRAFKPASEKQVEAIKKYCDVLKMKYPDFDKLDGNKDGKASQLIQKLAKLAADKPQPASEKQVTYIMNMQLCPDCDPLTDEQIAGLDKKTASQYIFKFQNAYAVWARSRLSPDQLRRIQQLCNMMESPIDYKSIIQLDVEAASKFISQLEMEFNRKDWQQTTLEPEDNRLEEKRNPKDYVENLRSMVARLYALLDMPVDEDTYDRILSAETPIKGVKELVDFVLLASDASEEYVKSILEDADIFLQRQMDEIFCTTTEENAGDNLLAALEV